MRGKIVLFDHPFPMDGPNAAAGYGKSIPYRTEGATRAAAFGAVAALVRHRWHRPAWACAPHTGQMHYGQGAKIPTAALSVEDAELLARLAARGPVTLHLVLEDGPRPDAISFNVLAELRGRERPDEIVVIGAHIDSWDVGQGAQDDGSGCAIVMEALAALQRAGPHPAPHDSRGALYLRGGRPGEQDLRRGARQGVAPPRGRLRDRCRRRHTARLPDRRRAGGRRRGAPARSCCWPRWAPR